MAHEVREESHEHTHVTPKGKVVTCYHKCKNTLTDASFWIGVTVSYPLEHALWEHLWPFSLLAELIGM